MLLSAPEHRHQSADVTVVSGLFVRQWAPNSAPALPPPWLTSSPPAAAARRPSRCLQALPVT